MKHATITETSFMDEANLSLMTKPRGRSVQRGLVSFSAAYFAGALVTDLVYWRIPDVLWERFSIWLIVAGLVMAGFAAIAYVIDLAGGRDTPAWPLVVGYALAALLSLINAFIHSRDGYTAVVPMGLMLSGLVILVLLLTASGGSALANHPRVGE
jgi:uncharacterized membrane protein